MPLINPTEHIASDAAQHGFGRRHAFDPRDRMHLMAVPPAAVITRRSRQWVMPKLPLDQGQLPQCVAYGWEHYLLASPIKNKLYKTPQELYDEAQAADEWPGNDYDGTSVRAGAKVLQTATRLGEYKWAFDVDTLTKHVLVNGPAVMGTNWYEGMSEPIVVHGESWITTEGSVQGGHCYVIKGVSLDKKCHTCGGKGAARIYNSWGSSYGENGKVWLCLLQLDQLIAALGEACMATELKFKEQV